VLFLLKDEQGKALLIAQATSKEEADEFGRAHVPEFWGESVKLEGESRLDAEEFWRVSTVQVTESNEQHGTSVLNLKVKAVTHKPVLTMTHIWVRGLDLPEEVIEDDLLTPEDHRDLALDHIARTSHYVGRLEIRKLARRVSR
jgi:hypothetical protein